MKMISLLSNVTFAAVFVVFVVEVAAVSIMLNYEVHVIIVELCVFILSL